MKTLKNRKSDFMTPEQAANNLLDNLKIRSQTEINDYLEEIAFERNMLVQDEDILGAEARLIVVEHKGLITISTKVSNSHRRRFCITHEMGHFELHREKQELFIDEVLMEWDKQKTKIEREANQFASALLMPERFFATQCLKAPPSLNILSRLSEDFNASLTATSLRFLKFTNQAVAVILSSLGVVQWAAYSDLYPAQKYPISKGTKIGMRTEAANTQNNIRPMRKVPASAWFGNKQLREGAKIKEQSWRLGRNNSVISLIWADESLVY